MTDNPSAENVRVTGEERSRPVFRLLARAAIELARLRRPVQTAEQQPAKKHTDEEGRHA